MCVFALTFDILRFVDVCLYFYFSTILNAGLILEKEYLNTVLLLPLLNKNMSGGSMVHTRYT